MIKGDCKHKNDYPIIIHFRDINGKRFYVFLHSVTEFNCFNWDLYDDENYEILMVEWGNYCIYSALGNERIYMKDLIGFFA